MRIIFLNRFYWPDEPATAQLLADLAEALAAAGHDVTVIASHPGDPRVPPRETHRGVHIERVASSRGSHSGLARKAADFATFHLGAMARLFRLVRRGETIITLTDPPLIGVGAWPVAAFRGARLFHWVQDIYPELAMELAGQRWLAVLRPLRNFAWRRADGCVTLGTDMAAVLAAAGVATTKLTVIPNWPPAGLTPQPLSAAAALRASWRLQDKFVVAYSGNLGRVHDLDPVLALAAALRGDERIALVFIGGGAQRLALEAEARRCHLDNVHFHPSQPRAQLAASLALGDVHLVTLRPGCERYVFPSKLYGIAAVGRPVIVIGPRDSELARLVTTHDFGRAFDRAEIAALAQEIRALAAAPAECARRGAVAAEFARTAGGAPGAAARWQALLAAEQAC